MTPTMVNNPFAPYRWVAVYCNGVEYPQIMNGVVRRTSAAPVSGLAGLRVLGPDEEEYLVPVPPGDPPEALVVRGTGGGLLADPRSARLHEWRFGFRRGQRWSGIRLTRDGMVETVADAPLDSRIA